MKKHGKNVGRAFLTAAVLSSLAGGSVWAEEPAQYSSGQSADSYQTDGKTVVPADSYYYLLRQMELSGPNADKHTGGGGILMCI